MNKRLENLLFWLGLIAFVVVLWLVLPAPPAQAQVPGAAAPASAPSRFIFSWPITGDPALAPRGGSTRGPELALDKAPSDAWRALQAAGLSAFERDRSAILAMAGSWRVSFDFLETTPFAPDAPRQRPYQSWATERVYVDRDEGGFISLAHILEMRIVKPDGTTSEPMVTKHWRQDWAFEPTHIVEYRGAERWTRRALSKEESRGRWSQTVWQVDESPRYAGTGRWEHNASFSTWISNEVWRPLPRREWSVRKDYQVLVGTNRHTIVPTGWLQEENNLKGVLDAQGAPVADRPYLAREYGVVRYERLAAASADFAAADHYYERTRDFWRDVLAAWERGFAEQGTIRLRAQVDQAELFTPLFAQAQMLADGKAVDDNATVIRETLEDMRTAR